MPASACCWSPPIRRTRRPTSSSGRLVPSPWSCFRSCTASRSTVRSKSQRYVANVKEHIKDLFGPHILKESYRQIDLAASMPGAEEMALFDRIGALIRGEDDRFDLIIFDTAPTGHTLRLIRMPELMEAWIRALSRSRRAMLGIEQDDATDPVMLSLARAARAPAGVSGAAAQPARVCVRARDGRRAVADRGNGAGDRTAAGRRRHHRRPGRQPHPAGDQPRSVPARAARAGSGVSRRDRSPIHVAPESAGAAAAVGRARCAARSNTSPASWLRRKPCHHDHRSTATHPSSIRSTPATSTRSPPTVRWIT